MKTVKVSGSKAMPSANTKPLEVMILAGGKSTRMKQDKALLRLHGKTLLERQFELGCQLTGRIDRVWVSGRPYKEQFILDDRPGWGPLGGLRSFLDTHSSQTRLLVYPVDMPLLDLEILESLIENLEVDSTVEAIHYQGFEFPLVLSVSDKLKRILDNLLVLPEPSRRSIRSLLLSLRTLRIPLGPGNRIKLMNVNTPEDWRICCEFENLHAWSAN